MVVKVKLQGLNIVRARGKWYVYVRGTGATLLRGFEGSKAALFKRLAMPDMMATYNAKRQRNLNQTYEDGTLGALVAWFQKDCPKWDTLSDATRRDYLAAFKYLAPEFDAPLDTINQVSLYEVRDRAVKDKWPRFADQMMAALSSMFSQAVKRGKMPMNPAKGLDKAHKSDPNSNREWGAAEWRDAIALAPPEIKTPLMIARYAGFRGQTIATLQWKQYEPHPATGKCLKVVARKNSEPVRIPATPELQAYLDGLSRTSLNIAVRNDGTPWVDEKQMQTAVSHFLRGIEGKSAVEAGATLHGLRVTYATEMRREGSDVGDVAAALGDRSHRMGEHYTRHVESETKVIRAFERKKKA